MYRSTLSLTSALDGVGGQRPPRPLYPRERRRTNCTEGWVSPRAGLDRCEKFRAPPEFDPQTFQHVASHYTDKLQIGAAAGWSEHQLSQWTHVNFSVSCNSVRRCGSHCV
jgi:hypothetical protein